MMCCPRHVSHSIYVHIIWCVIHSISPTVRYPHHISMLSTSYDPLYTCTTANSMLPTSYIYVVHSIWPTVYTIIYRGYMMWITCIYSMDNHVTHIIYRCGPQHMTYGIYVFCDPHYILCRPRHIPTAYVPHGIWSRCPRHIPTAYVAHGIWSWYPQYITHTICTHGI